MGYSKDNDFDRNRNVERSDLESPAPDDVAEMDNSENGPCESFGDGSESRISTNREIGLAERLRDALCSGGNGYLLTCQDGRKNGVMRWLQALDLQVVGACRADERLKPLLKLNVSSGVAEDRLMAQLSQHFEASEVGMLARCLCVPLVSIRVGKVIMEGTLLCPTTER
ncbi:hypothetical protein ACLOJK_012463 [Asimina triloba]